jgi:hypothetical protein
MRHLRDIVEVYQPKPEDEKRFVAKHGRDPATGRWALFQNMFTKAEYDDLFRGSNVKVIDREPEGHGYNADGSDEKHYESIEGDK